MIPYVNDGKQKEADDFSIDYERTKDVSWQHRLLLNRPVKVVTLGFFLAVFAPLLLYHFLFYPSMDLPPSDGFSTGSCLLPRSFRLPCGIGLVNDTDCHSQCCYDYELHFCFHRFPSRFSYILNEEWKENMTLIPRIKTIPFKRQDSAEIRLSIDEITTTHLSLTFYDAEKNTIEGRLLPERNYTYNISIPELRVTVNDTKGNNMFNTEGRPVIASENIWEIAFKMTDESMFGLGEIPLVEGTVKVLYNHDGSADTIPLIFSRTNDTYHGLLFEILEPTEVRVEGDNQIVVRSITNRGLKFHLFAGPEPKYIMKEVMNFLDFKVELEYWMLGAHICSETTKPTDVYDDLVEFTEAATKENIPYDSHCGVKPVVFHEHCEKIVHGEGFIKGMELIKGLKKRFIPHLSPYIFYTEANITEDNSTEVIEPRFHLRQNCSNLLPNFENLMLRTGDSKYLYKGTVDNKTVLYPDYEIASQEFINELWDGPEVDGFVLENNWPLDESKKPHNETRDALPYFTEHFQKAFNNTPQWNITKPNNESYIFTHNQYGNHFVEAFRLTSTNHIPIFTSTQWMTGEIVNRQKINASWTNLHRELVEAALGGISGHWLWSSPICGDTKYYNDESQTNLCVKWYMAATFMPLIKIYSKEVPRHPLSFTGTNKANILKALNHRYSLLPYFYTTLQKGPLLRPMFYQFPFSSYITNLRTQFSVGEDLLIVPNLQPSQSHVHVYMPPGQWYEFWSGLAIEAEEAEAVTMTTTDADFLVLIRAGAIVVMQKDVKDTAEGTRLNSDYSLTIALNCEEDNITTNNTSQENKEEHAICQAEGELHMNEHMKILFKANSHQLIIKAEGDNFNTFCDFQEATWSETIKEVNIFGLSTKSNNYDNLKNIVIYSYLCDLQTQEEIVVNFT